MTTDVETLARMHSGPLSVAGAIRTGRCAITGPADLVRAFPRWGGKSPLAHVPPAAPAHGNREAGDRVPRDPGTDTA